MKIRTVILLTALLLSGCGPTREPIRYYALTAAAPVQTAAEPHAAVALSIAGIPDYLDRLQIVMRSADSADMRIDNGFRWAEDLTSGITNALCEDLTVRLAPAGLVAVPMRPSTKTAAGIIIEILRFEGAPGGTSTIYALWHMPDPKAKTSAVHSYIRSVPSGRTEKELVDSLSKLLDGFSEELAAHLAKR